MSNKSVAKRNNSVRNSIKRTNEGFGSGKPIKRKIGAGS